VEEQGLRLPVVESTCDGIDGRRLGSGRLMRHVGLSALAEGWLGRRIARFHDDEPQRRKSADSPASTSPPIFETRDGLRSHGAHVRENGGSLPGQSPGIAGRIGRSDPLHFAGSDAAGSLEEIRVGELSRGFALDGRKREANDLPNRCQVVLRQIAKKGEKIEGHGRLVVDCARERASTLRALCGADREHDAHEATGPERTDDPGPGDGALRQMVRYGVSEGVRDRHGEGNVGEEHENGSWEMRSQRPASAATTATSVMITMNAKSATGVRGRRSGFGTNSNGVD
jgi:hypothetical protein